MATSSTMHLEGVPMNAGHLLAFFLIWSNSSISHQKKKKIFFFFFLAFNHRHLDHKSNFCLWHFPQCLGRWKILLFGSNLTCFVCCRLDGEMPDGAEVLNNSLVFMRPLQKNDSGVYRCEVANDIGLRSRDIRIRIQGEWETWNLPYPSYQCFPCEDGETIIS